jgi:hypothetical protein
MSKKNTDDVGVSFRPGLLTNLLSEPEDRDPAVGSGPDGTVTDSVDH